MIAAERDWMVVAPWWKWSDPSDPQVGRLTRPVFQKYETSDIANEFIKDPQHCLKFVAEDLVHSLQPAPSIVQRTDGRKRRFSEQIYAPDGTNTRKVFLDTHKRFYLVVCELHCDAPMLPRAAPARVCQVGFVVRRRTTAVPTCAQDEGRQILTRMGTARRRLATIAAVTATRPATTAGVMLQQAATATMTRQRASIVRLLELERIRLEEWANRFGIMPYLQGWMPTARDRVGCWDNVAPRFPSLGGEAVFPMRPLIPDPADIHHAGQFGTIYFGLLPTASSDTDPPGRPRFDDSQFYEVWCFVQRHKVAHPPGTPCPCPDGLFWSQPTEPYKLAAPFDLDGTSKRPVTVQLPDLNVLAAQARPTLGVAFAKPPGSIMISGDGSGPIPDGTRPDGEVCSVSIPLVTIVATFVFELFLPIVVLLFNLFFLLKLRFCFPSEIDVAAGVTAEFDLNAPVSEENSIDAAINASIDSSKGFEKNPAMRTQLKQRYSPFALANMSLELKTAGTPGSEPSTADGIEWEVQVQHS